MYLTYSLHFLQWHWIYYWTKLYRNLSRRWNDRNWPSYKLHADGTNFAKMVKWITVLQRRISTLWQIGLFLQFNDYSIFTTYNYDFSCLLSNLWSAKNQVRQLYTKSIKYWYVTTCFYIIQNALKSLERI